MSSRTHPPQSGRAMLRARVMLLVRSCCLLLPPARLRAWLAALGCPRARPHHSVSLRIRYARLGDALRGDRTLHLTADEGPEDHAQESAQHMDMQTR